ncbi:MAG TPA: polysaccharide biosynthesis tyrosine autokinase [Opitutaceae bacterium]|nr:polysaccharide biosynthesis tyrosine autokinase [Opitutaceae bacterium]
MAVATAQAPASATLDLREVVYLFRNRLGTVFICILLAAAGMATYLRQAHPVYASSALLEVAPPDHAADSSDYDSSDTLKTIQLKLASRPVLLGVIKHHHLESDLLATSDAPPNTLHSLMHWIAAPFAHQPTATDGANSKPLAPMDAELVRRLSERVSVSQVRGSRLISLTVEDFDPVRARKLAAAIIDEFFTQSRAARERDTATAREQLLAEARRVGTQFRAAEEKLEAYRTKYNAVSLEDRQDVVVERLRQLNQQVAAAKNDRVKWQAEADQVKRLKAQNPDLLLGVGNIAELPEIVELQKQVSLQEARIATLAQRYGPLHPTMIEAKSELLELRRSVTGALEKAGARIEESLQSSRATEDALERALATQEKAALELDRIAIPYHALEREVQANATMYQKILDTLQQHDVTGDLTPASNVSGIALQVVEPPQVPSRPARPRRLLLLALSLATGLFAGCGLVLGSRALDTSISSVDGAESALGISVLTTVPRSRHHRLNGRPVVLRFPASAQAEAFRSLLTALAMLPTDREQQCVLFTSAVPGEGKSFCALNCAATFAQQGLRTLLIDADLRRPSLRRLFADAGRHELAGCLADPRLFPQAVVPTPIPNLSCLGDSTHHPGSAELLGRDGMKTILALAANGYDRVVIDTAPLMAVSDVLHIAPHVPTICLVVQAGKTPRRLARRAIKLLAEVAHRPVTGLVLNKMNARAAGAQYHYYYYNA